MTESNDSSFVAGPSGGFGDESPRVVSQLLEMLREGKFRPGDRLPTQRDLAGRLGVSRPTLRTGARLLGTLGVLQIRKGSGMFFVGPPRSVSSDANPLQVMAFLQDLEPFEIVEARRSLESVIAGLAAERASSDDITSICDEIVGMYASLDDPEQFQIHNMQFHQAVAAAAGNRILAFLVDMVCSSLFEARYPSRTRDKDLKVSAEIHRRTYREIRDRRAEGARKAVTTVTIG